MDERCGEIRELQLKQEEGRVMGSGGMGLMQAGTQEGCDKRWPLQAEQSQTRLVR